MKALQIIFCVLACLCVAATVPVAVFFGTVYLIAPLGGAAIFGILMMFMKRAREPKPEKKKDFMDEE